MSIGRYGDGLFWLSPFSFPNSSHLINMAKNHSGEYKSEQLALKMIELSDLERDYSANNASVQLSCERVALRFMLSQSDVAEHLLNEDERAKAIDLYKRKQYNSKLLQKLLCGFTVLLLDNRFRDKLRNLFTLPILEEFQKAEEEAINRSHGSLKKIIEAVASGVKHSCYYAAENAFCGFFSPLDDSLNTLFISKVGYDFNQIGDKEITNESSFLLWESGYQITNAILQQALFDNSEFWAEHPRFCVVTFLNEISRRNDLRHAEKVLSALLENLVKIPNIDLVIREKFPLYMSQKDKLIESLRDQAFRFTFNRLTDYCDISKARAVPLCYPVTEANSDFFEIGKGLWSRFISEYNYPINHEEVNRYIDNEIERFLSKKTHNYDDIAVILDAALFRYSANNEDRRVFNAYFPNCFSRENIWKRVYLRAYAVTLISDDEQKQFSYLQRIFIDLIKSIERKIGICTTHQLDMTSREKHYAELKQMLKAYGVEASDRYKSEYIIALLDRDTALIEETVKFPMLEQIGDSIYGLAVAELLFYNPDSLFYPEGEYDPSGRTVQDRFEGFTQAAAQVSISKKLSFEKLYLRTGLPAKYLECDSLFFDYETIREEQLQALNQEKYLADSLEMIIGAIFIDKGIDTALSFAKELLRKTYPEHFSKEIHFSDENRHNEDIDPDYWQRILPAPYSEMSSAHHTIWNALHKVALVASLGTSDKAQRVYITNSFGNTAIYKERSRGGITWPLYFYLHEGFDSFLQRYGDTIREHFEKNNNL